MNSSCSVMKLNILLGFFLCFVCVESRMIPRSNIKSTQTSPKSQIINNRMKDFGNYEDQEEGNPHEKVLGLKSKVMTLPDGDSEEFQNYRGNVFLGSQDKCAVLVISNQGHTNMQQSLLRKYRYNKHGELIPGSVQYFIKFPQGQGTSVLVPLKDKSFSPAGGFVRYYKEVPPIPQTW